MEVAALLAGTIAGEPKTIEQVSINLFRRDKVCYYSQQRSDGINVSPHQHRLIRTLRTKDRRITPRSTQLRTGRGWLQRRHAEAPGSLTPPKNFHGAEVHSLYNRISEICTRILSFSSRD